MKIEMDKLNMGAYLIFKGDVVHQIEILKVTEFCYLAEIDNDLPQWLYIQRMLKDYSVIEKLNYPAPTLKR